MNDQPDQTLGAGHQPQAVQTSPSVFPVVLRPSSVLIKLMWTARSQGMCRTSRTPGPVASHPLRSVNNLFLIRTEEARRTTENTEPRMLLAESLTEQVIWLTAKRLYGRPEVLTRWLADEKLASY